MGKLTAKRPDIAAIVHDLSPTATSRAAERYGLSTLTGDADALASHPERDDLVVLSDVLYYEPTLCVLFWSVLARLIRPQGAVAIRVPLSFVWRSCASDLRRQRNG